VTTNKRKIDAVIFDMDGVLVDSEPLHHDALNDVLAEYGHHYTEEQGKELMGTTFDDTWRIVTARLPGLPDVELLKAKYDRSVVALVLQKATPRPGVHSLLAALKAQGLRLALASSSKRAWIDATLSAIGVDGTFSPIISGDMVARGKPAPDIFLLAAQQLGVPPERCLVIEDSPKGIEAARAAGMPVVAVRTRYTQGMDLPDANIILDSLEEFDISLLEDARISSPT
jgi:beta-phosphoglucomutase family hydrolase